ncbi:MAG: 16S rRNA (guanine(527)-N(7))-methyltransferase RsmG [Treponema sp.]|nr:16S rRNA (guanine(527)-N(7))-methyltransferase RsmG [Treponema sp.]
MDAFDFTHRSDALLRHAALPRDVASPQGTVSTHDTASPRNTNTLPHNTDDILPQGLSLLGFDDATIPLLAQKIDAYIKELQLFNAAYNLVNTSERTELIVRHVFDSIAPWRIIKSQADNMRLQPAPQRDAICALPQQNSPHASSQSGNTPAAPNCIASSISVGDIGSGGGLPGIPLALVFPQFAFTLVERMDKRCAFLENCVALLGLQNVRVLKSEAERVAPESFDIVVFRAFHPLDNHIAQTLLALTKRGGILGAYKAKRKNIEEEMCGVKSCIANYESIALHVPFMEEAERNFVLVKK